MEIDDAIQTLAKICQSLDTKVPQTATRPDALIADLNDLYVASTENRDFEELFEYDDVGSPTVTLLLSIEVKFDVWSHGRYDFVYDRDLGSLRMSYKYSHKRVDTKSVSSIARQMIGYATGHLEEVKASAQKGAGAPETEDVGFPRASKA